MRKCLYAQMGFICLAAVVLLVTITLGQNATPAPDSNVPATSASATAPVAQPAKKVWTNDDLGSLPVVTDSPKATTRSMKRPVASTAKTSAKTPSAASFQAQIARLQAQLPPIDDQISALQDALSGKPVEEARKFGWQKPDDWQTQLAALQKKHDDIEAQIQDVEDKARHSGVPTNAVP